MDKLIPTLVSELLYVHECVIIPGFGGFVSRHMGARLLPGINTIQPPSKSVLFNKNLVNNDGLLASALMERFRFSYQDAMNSISSFAESAHRYLRQHQRMEFEKIGVIYLDLEKNLQFEPTEGNNFLQSSFGLGEVLARPLPVEAKALDSHQIPVDRKQTITANAVESVAPVKRRSAWRLAAITAPVCLLLGFFIATSVAPKNSALASLNPFSVKEQPHYKTSHLPLPAVEAETANAENKIVLNENGTGTLTLGSDLKNIVFVYVRDTVVTESKKSLRPFSGVKFASVPHNVSGNYQVVVGCFKDKNNAERLVSTLNDRSIVAGISGTNDAGLYVVSVGGFDTRDSANVLLQSIRDHFPAAWLMKK